MEIIENVEKYWEKNSNKNFDKKKIFFFDDFFLE